MTYLNIWHYIAILIIFILFIIGIIFSFKQKNKKLLLPMIFSITLVAISLTFLLLFIIDKYTKHIEIHKLKSRKLPSLEKVIYSGIVKNTGNYTVGKVKLTIKLVSKGKSNDLSNTTFYKSSGFLDIFSGIKKKKAPTSVEKTFIIARDLKPRHLKTFRVILRYPSNFRNVSEYTSISAH